MKLSGIRRRGRGGVGTMVRRLALGACAACVLAAGLLPLAGCSSRPTPEPRAVAPVVRDTPAILRGTIGAEATLRGVEPQLVSGLGIVVGLNGTGGGELPDQVMATMERELARGGIGRGARGDTGPLKDVTPRQFLRSPDVAVVIVEAAIPRGAPDGTTFDVRVRALPGSSVSSLEGGTLWTTELRLGPAAVFGATRARKIAEAKGPIFINPFAEPGRPEGDAVTRTVGRILDGGRVTDSLAMQLVLDNASHSRARSIVSAINSRFPESPGDSGPTARGLSAERIEINVPFAYRTRGEEFIQLLRFTRIDQAFPQEYARRYVEELKRSPGLAEELSWCLQALGKPAVPFVVSMYDYPEIGPRMAALRSGARLGDPRTAPHLREMARSGPTPRRLEAIRLLGALPMNPQVNLALRELAGAPELEIRTAAYEALAKRLDPYWLERMDVAGKFQLDIVPAGDPLVYITQQGTPRIVLFGEGLKVNKPTLVSAWSDRLMLAAETTSSSPRIYYRDLRTGKVITQPVPEDAVRLIEFMAHAPSPENPSPGLAMTYSEVVGALYEIVRQNGIGAAFATERDRLLAELLKAAEVTVVTDRPETREGDPVEDLMIYAPDRVGDRAGDRAGGGAERERAPAWPAPEREGDRPSLVEPLFTAPVGEKDGRSSR